MLSVPMALHPSLLKYRDCALEDKSVCSGGDLLTPFVVIVSVCVFMTFFKIHIPYRTEELG